MKKLDGSTAMVTGGGSGIGLAASKILARHGAHVMVTDVLLDAAQAAAETIRAEGGKADACQCDIGDEAQIRDAIQLVVEQCGKLDILHNNAALVSPDILATDTDVATIPVTTWDQVMAVTLRGTMLGCQYGVQAMLESGGGTIINTASMYGISAFNRMPAYSVAKAAIIMLTQHVATAYGRDNIRCNAVAPGLVKTPTADTVVPRALFNIHAEAAALPYAPTPEDIAETVLYLASDASRCVSGEVIKVDCGTTSHLPTYAQARQYFSELA